MALTRKMLKAMGIEDEKIDQIIEAHTETVSGLKESLEEAKEKADSYDKMQKDLEKAQADLEAVKKDGWKEKHDKLKKEYDDYKAEQANKETRAAKEAAVRAYLESKGIKGTNLTIAMRGLTAEVEAAELDGDKLKDTKALDDLISGEFAGLVGKETKTGAGTSNPPTNTGSGTMTKADIYKRDEKGRYVLSAAERQKALVDNKLL